MDNQTDMLPASHEVPPDKVRLPRVTAAGHILAVLRQDILSVRLKPGEARRLVLVTFWIVQGGQRREAFAGPRAVPRSQRVGE